MALTWSTEWEWTTVWESHGQRTRDVQLLQSTIGSPQPSNPATTGREKGALTQRETVSNIFANALTFTFIDVVDGELGKVTVEKNTTTDLLK